MRCPVKASTTYFDRPAAYVFVAFVAGS